MIVLITCLITLIVLAILILINAYTLKVIYLFALTPIFSLFNVVLPTLNFGVFILMWILYSCLVNLFITNKDKNTYYLNNPQDVVKYFSNLFSTSFTLIMKRALLITIICILYVIFF